METIRVLGVENPFSLFPPQNPISRPLDQKIECFKLIFFYKTIIINFISIVVMNCVDCVIMEHYQRTVPYEQNHCVATYFVTWEKITFGMARFLKIEADYSSKIMRIVALFGEALVPIISRDRIRYTIFLS